MDKIINYIITSDILRDKDIARARVELGERTDEYLVGLVYASLKWDDRQLALWGSLDIRKFSDYAKLIECGFWIDRE
jgi:hypothetical protein